MPDLPIIDVNRRGVDASGGEYHYRAEPAAIAAGLVIERDVLLRYPDGRIESGIEVRLTPKGMTEIKRQMVADGEITSH